MKALMSRLAALWRAWHRVYEFNVTLPAKSRGGFAGATVTLRRPDGYPQVPEVEKRGSIYQSLGNALEGISVERTIQLSAEAVQLAALPYVVERITVYPLNDRQLVSVYQDTQTCRRKARMP